jgi:hypothetical protein
MRNVLFSTICLLVPFFPLIPVTSPCQEAKTISSQVTNDIVEGTVSSLSRETMVVRTSDDQFQLFIFDQDTRKPRTLQPGARVRVSSTPTDESGVRLATNVTVLEEAPAAQAGKQPASKQATPPPSVSKLEREIKRNVRRWRVGFRAGAALDPELFLFGVHSQIGPIFTRNVSFRPNAEFAFGEVTDLIALNLEAVYRLPITARQGRWSAYAGAGPALNFIHQSFSGPRKISFGNFDYETGFNVLTGFQSRRGTFVELKTSLWSHPAPTLRLIVGYTF